MKAVMIGLALGLIMGCGEKTDPQGRAKDSVNPTAPDSKEERLKASSKTTPKPGSKAAGQKSGTVLWEFETGDVVSSSAAIGSDGTVYVGSKDKMLYALNGKTGVKIWDFK